MIENLETQLRKQVSRLMKKLLSLREFTKILTENNKRRRRALFIYTQFKKYIKKHDEELYEDAFKYINKKYPMKK